MKDFNCCLCPRWGSHHKIAHISKISGHWGLLEDTLQHDRWVPTDLRNQLSRHDNSTSHDVVLGGVLFPVRQRTISSFFAEVLSSHYGKGVGQTAAIISGHWLFNTRRLLADGSHCRLTSLLVIHSVLSAVLGTLEDSENYQTWSMPSRIALSN